MSKGQIALIEDREAQSVIGDILKKAGVPAIQISAFMNVEELTDDFRGEIAALLVKSHLKTGEMPGFKYLDQQYKTRDKMGTLIPMGLIVKASKLESHRTVVTFRGHAIDLISDDNLRSGIGSFLHRHSLNL